MTGIDRIHHINFLVRDLSETSRYFTALTGQPPKEEILEERNVKTARFVLGEIYLVLVQPLSELGPVAEILAERGEGCFLLSFGVTDLQQALQHLEQHTSLRPEGKTRKGLDDWTVQDITAPDGLGIVLQLCQSQAGKS